VVPTVPESPTTVFLPVVMRRKLSFEMPHKNTNADRISDLQKQMGMIRSKTVIQHHYLESPHRLPKPLAIFIAGNIKAQKKASVVTSMGKMINVSRQKNSCVSWHRFPPKLCSESSISGPFMENTLAAGGLSPDLRDPFLQP
jgi:hypothetical protein